MIERLTTDAALARIRALKARHQVILGVDGFRSVEGGYTAPLDLILDLSGARMSADEAALKAEEFVASNAGDDVTFEIVA
jgi:hypothetical protein